MSFEEQAYANQRHSYDIIAALMLIVLLPSYFIFTSIPPSNHILSLIDVQSSVRKPIKCEEIGQSLMSSFLFCFKLTDRSLSICSFSISILLNIP